MAFEGFSRQTMDFLMENRARNSREWFAEHRSEYESCVLTPLRELVIALTPAMLKIDPLFTVEPKVNRTISRIYRDTRFSRDKSLYRDEMWITFMRNKKFWEGLPGYYFIFGPDIMSCGVGYYEASPDSMARFREMVLGGEKPFKTFLAAYRAQSRFRVSADRYKRSKYPKETPERREWLDLKNINFERGFTDPGILFSPSLAAVLEEDFVLLKPMYDFICAVEAGKRHKET